MANTQKTEKKIFDISKFYSRKNEENGVWFELEIDGTPSGLEACVVGPTSSTAWVVNDEYQKGLSEAKAIEDPKERAKKVIEVSAKRYAGLTVDIRAKDGSIISDGESELSKADLYAIMKESPAIQDEIYRFYNNSENFLGKKKND